MRPTTELEASVAGANNTHTVAVLIAKKGHGAHLLGFRLCCFHDFNCRVRKNITIDDCENLLKLLKGLGFDELLIGSTRLG